MLKCREKIQKFRCGLLQKQISNQCLLVFALITVVIVVFKILSESEIQYDINNTFFKIKIHL